MSENQRLSKRLWPLYLSRFLQGFVLWYAIEKLFLRNIGFDDAQIALAGILVSASMVVFQIPSGILADRWSRRGVLILSSVLLLLSTLINALSHDVTAYIASVLWGAFAAMCFGTYDAVIYDTLEEEVGSSKSFEHYYGRVQLYGSLAIGVGALLSGVVVQMWGLRATFWLSMPFIILSVVTLLRFREPTVHKAQTKAALLPHITRTLRAVMQKGYVFWIILPLVLFTMIERLMINLSPLWYLAFALPVIFWGPAYAVIDIGTGLGGPIASRVKASRFRLLLLGICTGLASLMLAWKISLVVVGAQLVLIAGYRTFTILLNRQLHDALPSNIRAGASSTVGTLAQLVFLPTAYVFGWLSDTYTVFQAAWLVIAVTMVTILIFCLKALPHRQDFSIRTKDVTGVRSVLS